MLNETISPMQQRRKERRERRRKQRRRRPAGGANEGEDNQDSVMSDRTSNPAAGAVHTSWSWEVIDQRADQHRLRRRRSERVRGEASKARETEEWGRRMAIQSWNGEGKWTEMRQRNDPHP